MYLPSYLIVSYFVFILLNKNYFHLLFAFEAKGRLVINNNKIEAFSNVIMYLHLLVSNEFFCRIKTKFT